MQIRKSTLRQLWLSYLSGIMLGLGVLTVVWVVTWTGG